MTYRKKLIEVAPPPDAINRESAREKPVNPVNATSKNGVRPRGLLHWIRSWLARPRPLSDAGANSVPAIASAAAREPHIDFDAARRALDDLFANAKAYRSSKEYLELLDFIAKFRSYSPFNAMLTYMQRPGARFVAPAHRWARDYGRTVKPGARPIVILQPMGPVMFVFDVSDTEGAKLPVEVENPFAVAFPPIADAAAKAMFSRLVDNAKRDGVAVIDVPFGSQQAGRIEPSGRGEATLKLTRGRAPNEKSIYVVQRYVVHLDQRASTASRLATLAHELAHLYCGHLGSPNENWWPNRTSLDKTIREFEAECVAFALCERIGLKTRSAEYLSGYVQTHPSTPEISLDAVLKSVQLVERMMTAVLAPRRKGKDKSPWDKTPDEEEDQELFFS